MSTVYAVSLALNAQQRVEELEKKFKELEKKFKELEKAEDE